MVNVRKDPVMLYRMQKTIRMPTWQFVLYKIIEYLVIFLIGGFAYAGIEILWRGHTHVSMFIVGGLCLLIIGFLNEGIFPQKFGIIPQMLMGGIIITIIEFFTGLIVNVGLGLNVWDYSNLPFNIMGQICLPFTLAWILLSFVAIVVDDFVRHFFFGESWLTYKLWTVKD